MQLLAFVLYFLLILGVGLFFFFRSKSNDEKEYFLGGRSMGPWVTAMSAQASDMSGWLLMGFPGSILAFSDAFSSSNPPGADASSKKRVSFIESVISLDIIF